MEPTMLNLQNVNNRYENIKNIISDEQLKDKDIVIQSIKREIKLFNQDLKDLNPALKQHENEFKFLNKMVDDLVSTIKDEGHYNKELLKLEKTMKVFDQKISKNLEYLIYILDNESVENILKLIPQFSSELFMKKDENGDTAFHIALTNQTGVEVLKAMVDHAGIEGVMEENKEGLTVLDLAAESNKYTQELKGLLQLVNFKSLEPSSQSWIQKKVLVTHQDRELTEYILKNADLTKPEIDGSFDLPIFDLLYQAKEDIQTFLPFFSSQSFYTKNDRGRTVLQQAFVKDKLDLKTLEIMCACGGKKILDAVFSGEKNKGFRGATILDIKIEKRDLDFIETIVEIKGLENLTEYEFFSIWNLAFANNDLSIHSIIKDSKILNYDQNASHPNPEKIQVWKTDDYFKFHEGIMKSFNKYQNDAEAADDLICFAKDVNNWTKDPDGNTFLHFLLQAATPSPLLQKLLEIGVGDYLNDPYNQKMHEGDLILHPDALEELLDGLADPTNTSPLKELLPELEKQFESGEPLMLKSGVVSLIKKLLDAGADPFIFNNISPLVQKLLEMGAGSFLNDPYNQEMDNGDLVLHPDALKELVDELSDPQNTSPLKELLPELEKQLKSGTPLILKSDVDPLSKKPGTDRDPVGLTPYDMILENEINKQEYLPHIAQMKSLYEE